MRFWSGRLIIVFDAVEDAITVVTPVRPRAGVTAKAAHAHAVERLSAIVDALDRPLGKAAARRSRARRSPARRTAALQHQRRRFQTHGAARQGIHFRRRHLSGRAVAAFRSPVPAAALCALSRAAAGQSVAVSVFPRLRHLRGRRLKPGSPGQNPPRHRDHSPARRHAPTRRHPARRQGAWSRSCSPIRKNAPSI